MAEPELTTDRVRISFYATPAEVALITLLAAKRGVSRTQVLRQGLADSVYISSVYEQGNTLLVEYSNRATRKLQYLYA